MVRLLGGLDLNGLKNVIKSVIVVGEGRGGNVCHKGEEEAIFVVSEGEFTFAEVLAVVFSWIVGGGGDSAKIRWERK